MTIIKSTFCSVFYGLILLFSTSCLENINQKKDMLLNCPFGLKLSDVVQVEKHYADFVDKETQYIAFKRFPYGHYSKLVSLVNNGSHYILSVSLLFIPNATLSKEIDADVGREIFERIGEVRQLDYLDEGDHWHPDCVIVGIKYLDSSSVSYLYNPPTLFIQNFTDHENSGLRLYSVLTMLANEELPNHDDRIYSAYLETLETIVKENGEIAYLDPYVRATISERTEFVRALLRNPFFEIENPMNK